MGDKIRYVTKRRDKNGVRWYWQRKGWPLTKLPDDPSERAIKAIRLNERADAAAVASKPQDGTIAWVIDKYRQSERYKTLAQGTVKYYKRFMDDVLELGPTIDFRHMDRRTVIDFVESYDEPHKQRQVAAVLRNLFETALYYGYAEANHAANLRLATTEARERWWTQDEASQWISAAADHPKGQAMSLAFALLFYTAQRPMDVLAMTWAQFDAERGAINLRQQKTGKLLSVAAHPDLVQQLKEARQAAASLTIVAHQGRAISYPVFLRAFGEIRAMAGISDDAQPRDLRRTAALAMAQGGATEAQIAAVTGHSIERTRTILETYLPRTFALSEAGISKLYRL